MSLSSRKIENSDITTYGVVSAPDVLTGTATQNKQVFDKLIRDRVKGLYNSLIDDLLASTAAGEIGCGAVGTHPADDVQGALEYLYGTTTEGVAKAVAEALKAEGNAIGKQNGVDVTSESPYYHNNAKYYSDNADADATSCSTLKGQCDAVKTSCDGVKTACDGVKTACDAVYADCVTKRNDCSDYYSLCLEKYTGCSDFMGDCLGYKNDCTRLKGECEENKEDCDDDLFLCNSAKSDCQNASTSASASKLASEGWSVGKQNGVDVGSESVYYHNNAKWFADQLNPQNKEDKGYLTIGGVQYVIDTPTSVDPGVGTAGHIIFVTEA